jgi:hypothetical protein
MAATPAASTTAATTTTPSLDGKWRSERENKKTNSRNEEL